MKTLITIAGRAGSKGLPGKNIRPFCGKPLIFWSIDQAIEFYIKQPRSCDVDIAVCSDSTSLLALVNSNYGNVILKSFGRTKELSIDEAGKINVLRYMVKHELVERECNSVYDNIIDLDITNPLRSIYDIQAILKMLRYGPDTVMSVVPARRSPYFNQIEGRNGTSRISKIFPGTITRRQDSPVVWDLNCNLYAYKREWLMDDSHIHPVSDNSMIYVMPDYTFCETDTLFDFELAEHLYKKYVM